MNEFYWLSYRIFLSTLLSEFGAILLKMPESFLLNDSVCITFSSKCKRLFHPGPIFGLSLVIVLTLVGIWVILSTILYLWKPFALFNIIFISLLSIFILRSYTLSAWYGPGFVTLGWRPVSSHIFSPFF